MACNHKFLDDLTIRYADWEICTLFIGTFNPGWKSCVNNTALWFYGRPHNQFWCILPHIHGHNTLKPGNRTIWIEYCRKNKLAITDIITSLDNANEGDPNERELICNFIDPELCRFEITLTNIPRILEAHPTIKQICITRRTLDECMVSWFQPTIAWINANPQRGIQIRHLDSPAGRPIRGIAGMNFCNYVADQWEQQGYQVCK